MAGFKCSLQAAVVGALAALATAAPVHGQGLFRFVFPEQRRTAIRDPSMLPEARLPDLPPPRTVSDPAPDVQPYNLALDEALRTALENSAVVRVLTGISAASSGRTIYDPAIANTAVDQARGRFDPALNVTNQFNRRNVPAGVFDPADPTRARIVGDPTHDYDMGMGVSKTTVTGGSAQMNVFANRARTRSAPLPLNPRASSSVELSYTQPLLQGGGLRANLAPVVLARIDTERSFFQLKDSVQQMVLGVIEAYWAVVSARTEVWARRQQVEQGREALDLTEAGRAVGRLDAIDVAEFRSALANFQASLVSAETNLLHREAALRNILGWPPDEPARIVPVTPPIMERLVIDWNGILRLAEEQRPDLIELKLIIEADQQQLLVARNGALPRVDAVALYRWNGLEGRMPDRDYIAAGGGRFTGWQFGVNFSVPLGLRASRAALRQQELILARDRVNLDQGLHNAGHVLATTYRNLAQFYEEYKAFNDARRAARVLLDGQSAEYRSGRPTLYLNVRQAITDWGNAISAESQALAQYNTELATLERQTGTILETHGIRFFEERYGSVGPLGRLFRDRCYPMGLRPGPNEDQYETTAEPAEDVFDLNAPLPRRRMPPRNEPSDVPGVLPAPRDNGVSPAPMSDGNSRATPRDPIRLRLEIPERIPPPPPER